MQAKSRVVVSIGAVLGIGAAGLFFASAPGQSQQPASAPPPVPVKAVAAERRDIPHLVETVGTVASLQGVVVRAQVDGILTEILFNEGDRVEKGQLLATIDDRALSAALAAAEASLERDRALLKAAELDLARYRSLAARDNVPRQTLDRQVAEVDQLRAAVRLGEANVRTAQVNLSHTRILSPVSGRAGIRRIDVGNLVRAADADGIVSVAQVDPISVIFPVPQSTLGRLRDSARDPAGARVEALDRDTGRPLAEGRIIAFDNGLDPASGTARVRAQFDNGAENLAPGAFVAVRVRTGLTPDAVVLPSAAVRPGIEGPFVYRVREGKAERVPVSLGYRDDEVAVIAQGVGAGDIVVSDGYSRLNNGTRVAVAEQVAAAPAPANTMGSRQ